MINDSDEKRQELIDSISSMLQAKELASRENLNLFINLIENSKREDKSSTEAIRESSALSRLQLLLNHSDTQLAEKIILVIKQHILVAGVALIENSFEPKEYSQIVEAMNNPETTQFDSNLGPILYLLRSNESEKLVQETWQTLALLALEKMPQTNHYNKSLALRLSILKSAKTARIEISADSLLHLDLSHWQALNHFLRASYKPVLVDRMALSNFGHQEEGIFQSQSEFIKKTTIGILDCTFAELHLADEERYRRFLIILTSSSVDELIVSPKDLSLFQKDKIKRLVVAINKSSIEKVTFSYYLSESPKDSDNLSVFISSLTVRALKLGCLPTTIYSDKNKSLLGSLKKTSVKELCLGYHDLSYLSLYLTSLSDDQFQAFCNVLRNPHLKKLDISRCNIEFLDFQKIKKLFNALKRSSITSLVWRELPLNSFTSETLNCVVSYISIKDKLHSLDLSGSRFENGTTGSIIKLFEGINESGLEELILQNITLEPSNFVYFAQYYEFIHFRLLKAVKKLDISEWNAGDVTPYHLAQIAKHMPLAFLKVGCANMNKLSDNYFRSLESIINPDSTFFIKTLTTLNLTSKYFHRDLPKNVWSKIILSLEKNTVLENIIFSHPIPSSVKLLLARNVCHKVVITKKPRINIINFALDKIDDALASFSQQRTAPQLRHRQELLIAATKLFEIFPLNYIIERTELSNQTQRKKLFAKVDQLTQDNDFQCQRREEPATFSLDMADVTRVELAESRYDSSVEKTSLSPTSEEPSNFVSLSTDVSAVEKDTHEQPELPLNAVSTTLVDSSLVLLNDQQDHRKNDARFTEPPAEAIDSSREVPCGDRHSQQQRPAVQSSAANDFSKETRLRNAITEVIKSMGVDCFLFKNKITLLSNLRAYIRDSFVNKKTPMDQENFDAVFSLVQQICGIKLSLQLWESNHLMTFNKNMTKINPLKIYIFSPEEIAQIAVRTNIPNVIENKKIASKNAVLELINIAGCDSKISC